VQSSGNRVAAAGATDEPVPLARWLPANPAPALPIHWGSRVRIAHLADSLPRALRIKSSNHFRYAKCMIGNLGFVLEDG